jgi:hypothetical protein
MMMKKKKMNKKKIKNRTGTETDAPAYLSA